jgi:hypothetical protein
MTVFNSRIAPKKLRLGLFGLRLVLRRPRVILFNFSIMPEKLKLVPSRLRLVRFTSVRLLQRYIRPKRINGVSKLTSVGQKPMSVAK